MQYRSLPKTDTALSLLGFGCMRLPLTHDNTLDEPLAIRQIRYAADHGVNYFDTAWPYHGGQSEPVLGKALDGGYRNKVHIATKLPSWMVTSRSHMDDFLDRQLGRLNTDRIDFYLLHNLAGPMWQKLLEMDVLDFLDRAKESGKIQYAGFSFHGRIDDFKTIVDSYPWEFCQIQYNFLDTRHQAGTDGLTYAAQRDLGIIIMEPLRGGNLGLPTPPREVADIWARAPKPRTPAAWGLHWVMNHPAVTCVLSGMNDEAHIQENIQIAELATPRSLSQAELSLVSEAADTYKQLMKVACTGCEYCKPCPEGVNISGAFEILNRLHLFKNEPEAKFMYAVRCSGLLTGADQPGWAANCIQCGSCLDKCPQEIPIPDMLEVAARELEDDQLDQRVVMARKMLNMGDDD